MSDKTARRPIRRDISDLTGLRGGKYVRVSRAKNEPGGVTEKSTADQEADGDRIFERRGITAAGVYRDDGISASRFTDREREHFNRMLGDVRAGKLDLIWFWELSRSQRRLDVFADLRDTCRDHGVLWMVGETVYDPGSYEHMLTLGMLSVVAEGESEIKSKNVQRGKEYTAMAGGLAGPVQYGYRTRYDPVTRRPIREAATFGDGDPRPAGDAPAMIVKEIFTRWVAGISAIRIAEDLNARGIPVARRPGHGASSASPRWWAGTILRLVHNPAYIRRVVHQGKVLEGVTGAWPALIGEETFWAAQQVRSQSWAAGTRPSRAVHLLSHIARCQCGEKMVRHARGAAYSPRRQIFNYMCTRRGCWTAITMDALDRYVTGAILVWLSDPAVYTALTELGDSAAAAAARADAERLRAELEEVRQLAESGEMSPVMAARTEKAKMEQLADAERIAEESALPPVLTSVIGPRAADRWAALDLAVKRQIIRAVAEIRVRPVGKGNYHGEDHVAGRVTLRWLLGA